MTARQRLLLLGASGQLGRELRRVLPRAGSVMAPRRADLDLTSAADVRRAIRLLRPTVVVNAAGYALVDQAESERALCAVLNADVPGHLARECRAVGATFVHFSTDYVFDGQRRTPYRETDEPRPLSVYGQTKRDGELAVAHAGGRWFVLRTSWLHAPHGRNFPSTILRLARERAELRVVDDQIGAPTAASAVADGVCHILGVLARADRLGVGAETFAGIYHMSAAGCTSWYEFARQILTDDPCASEHVCQAVHPISTAEYPAPARRPAYSVLDNTKLFDRFGIRLPNWIDQWRVTAQQLPSESRATVVGAMAAPRAGRTTV